MNVWRRELNRIYSSFTEAFPEGSLTVGTSPHLGNLVVLARGDGAAASALDRAVQLAVQEAPEASASAAADQVREWSAAAKLGEVDLISLLQQGQGGVDPSTLT